MRKYQKQLLLDLIQTIYEGHRVIKKYIGNGEIESAQDLLTECQNAAVQIGTTIEVSEGEGFVTVHYLEEYCDALFQVYENVSDNISDNRAYKFLNKKIAEVKSSIDYDIKVRLEVAFMPYKASMWDSMESVYVAASNDLNCDVFCIPIPYFDKNPDGTLGQMHYEGDIFPKGVKVTNWQEYNTQVRHPDIIFLQNPYDNNNLVTTVHPIYYTARLREHTDCLAYLEYGIPLWIFKTPTPYDHIIPGWFNFDLFFTYSREYAINQENAMKLVKPNIQTKFMPLGSPKFDKVINSKKRDFELPDKWREIICNRKVILFNTSLASMLKDTEHYIDRLCSILKIFRERKDITLWWRPHPLSIATMQSMRTELAEKYINIVESYKQEGWGIYDDSMDLHRAIVYTDAYYGDESSVVYLYCATGKPFTICGNPHQCYNFTKDQENFELTLEWRIKHMRDAKGGNLEEYNNCMSWYVFYEDLDYEKFLELFLHYIVNEKKYQLADTYRKLQLKIFKDFVVNPDGTAGKKIYDYCKKTVLTK